MPGEACITKEAKGLGFFEKYLTMVGVLIEVPVMLILVRICLKTRGWFSYEKERSDMTPDAS